MKVCKVYKVESKKCRDAPNASFFVDLQIWLFGELGKIRQFVNQSRHNVAALQSMLYVLCSIFLKSRLATCYLLLATNHNFLRFVANFHDINAIQRAVQACNIAAEEVENLELLFAGDATVFGVDFKCFDIV